MKFIIYALISCNFFIVSNIVKSDDIFIIISKKQEAKKSSRWSLGEWMMTRKAMDAQDRWLALHSSTTVFEGGLSGDLTNYDKDVGGVITEKKSTHGSLELYLSIFGLMGEYSSSDEKYTTEGGQFILRIFGKSVQDTSIALTYGLVQGDGQRTSKNNYAGAKATVYLTSFLGVDGEYRDYNDYIDVNNQTISGYYKSYGAFVDLFFFRVFANSWTEKLAETKRSGVATGLKIFF